MDITRILALSQELLELQLQAKVKEAELRAFINGGKVEVAKPAKPKPTTAKAAKAAEKTGLNGVAEIAALAAQRVGPSFKAARAAPKSKGRQGRRRPGSVHVVEWLYTGQLYVQAAKALEIGTLGFRREGPRKIRTIWLTEKERSQVRQWSKVESDARWPRKDRPRNMLECSPGSLVPSGPELEASQIPIFHPSTDDA